MSALLVPHFQSLLVKVSGASKLRQSTERLPRTAEAHVRSDTATPPTLVQCLQFHAWHMPPSLLPQGLRTLVVAGKTLEEDDWAAWDARYQQAAADLEHRDELVRQGLVRVGGCLRHTCMPPQWWQQPTGAGWTSQHPSHPPAAHLTRGVVNPVQVAQCAEVVERDLQLTGVTAIEDKLQVVFDGAFQLCHGRWLMIAACNLIRARGRRSALCT